MGRRRSGHLPLRVPAKLCLTQSSAALDGRLVLQDEVLFSVEEFTGCVEVTGVGGGLDDHVQHD